MAFTAKEKKYLKTLVQKEIRHYKKERGSLFIALPIRFIKGGHDFKHFLQGILKKLK